MPKDFEVEKASGSIRVGPVRVSFSKEGQPEDDFLAENLRLRRRIEELEARIKELESK